VLLYQAAAIRLVGFDGFCNARKAAVELAHTHVDSPAGAGLTYDGLLVWSPITAYPLVPYTPCQLPCVVVSVFTNVTPDSGASKNKPLATAFGPATKVTRITTCPVTFHTRYTPPLKLAVRLCVFRTFPLASRMATVSRLDVQSQSRQYSAI